MDETIKTTMPISVNKINLLRDRVSFHTAWHEVSVFIIDVINKFFTSMSDPDQPKVMSATAVRSSEYRQ
jgi:hypothetical protein